MMQTATQTNNIPLAFEKIQNEPQMELNSQGERVEVKPEPQQQLQQPQEQSGSWWEDIISLAETPLGSTMNDLMPATDDTGMEHKIISWGHVLKSTHDLARWSEKTGALRVNTQESFDSINDSVVLLGIDTPLKSNTNNNNNNKNNSSNNNNNNNGRVKNGNGNGKSRSVGGRQWVQKGGKSEIIKTWPVLKSTHDQATLAEKRGGQINPAGSLEALDDLAGSGVKQQQGGRQQRGGNNNNRGKQQQRGNNNKGESGGRNEGSEILQSWPVLKSTHDAATRGEKNGSINSAEAGGLDLASNGSGLKLGAGSLQSGLDTQGGSHMQLDSEKIKETPESAMQALNVHV